MQTFEAQVAAKMIGLLDLTELSLYANPKELSKKAQTPYGPVAGVCVLPSFVAELKPLLPQGVRLITVANFPQGDLNLYRTQKEIRAALEAGVDEIDVVFPYHAFMNHQAQLCEDFLYGVREASQGITLKIIIESGALKSLGYVERVSKMVIRSGADFIKTSTGKISSGATVEGVETILKVMEHNKANERIEKTVGLKISGGVGTFAQALTYLEVVMDKKGGDWLTPSHFRFGASSLLDALLEVIAQN